MNINKFALEVFKLSGEGWNGEYLNGNDTSDEKIWETIKEDVEKIIERL